MSDNSPIRDLVLMASTCLGRAARRTANMVTRAYNQQLSPLGLEVTQFTILCAVALEKAQSSAELAELVGVERSTLARNLDRLIAMGLIAAEKGEGRRIVHRLTDKGSDRVAEAIPLWRNAQDAILARLPAEKEGAIREDLRLLRHAARGLIAETA